MAQNNQLSDLNNWNPVDIKPVAASLKVDWNLNGEDRVDYFSCGQTCTVPDGEWIKESFEVNF